MPKTLENLSVVFFVAVGVILVTQNSSAQTTVAVGNCGPHLVSYTTISEAVAAVTPNSTVFVCPGTYPEQVTIAQPLILMGLKSATGAEPVITVPSGGLLGDDVQLSVQGTADAPFAVNISNLSVDGTGSGVECSTGSVTGIKYEFASGTIEHVNVRHQSPGGCGIGIELLGGLFVVNTVNVLESRIEDFDESGISASSDGATGFLVNLTSNSVVSLQPVVQSGIEYFMTDGVAERNSVVLSGGTGVDLLNFFSGMTARGNTVIGATIGITAGTNEGLTPTSIDGNYLFKNGTGILVFFSGERIVKANAIVLSSTTAINLDCADQVVAENNQIFGAPVGIANISSEDILTGNTFFDVSTATSACP